MRYTHYMEQNNKNSPWGVVIVIILLGIAVWFIGHRPQTAPLAQSEAACFYSEVTGSQGLKDISYLRLSGDRGMVTGDLGTLPAEKDAMRGTLTGTITDDGAWSMLDAAYTYQAEGMTATEERSIRFDATHAEIAYGEMIDAGDGTWVYKDPSSISYSLSIPRVACTDYDASLSTALPAPTPVTVTVRGTYICLPHKDTTGPQTLECAMGIKTDAAGNYALDFSMLPAGAYTSGDARVSVTGELVPVEALSSDMWQKYDMEGIIRATSVTKL